MPYYEYRNFVSDVSNEMFNLLRPLLDNLKLKILQYIDLQTNGCNYSNIMIALRSGEDPYIKLDIENITEKALEVLRDYTEHITGMNVTVAFGPLHEHMLIIKGHQLETLYQKLVHKREIDFYTWSV